MTAAEMREFPGSDGRKVVMASGAVAIEGDSVKPLDTQPAVLRRLKDFRWSYSTGC